MNAFDKLKQARNVSELAQEIEPLAQALAKIADDGRAAIAEQLATQQTQAEHWNAQQATVAASWQTTCQEAQATLHALQRHASDLTMLNRHTTLRQIVVGAVSGLLAALVMIGSWLWLTPWTPTTAHQPVLDARFEAQLKALNVEQQAQLETLMEWK